jgi:hypothetical protein
VHARSLRLISPFPGIVPGILFRESRGAHFQYPKFEPFDCRDRFAFRRDRVRSDELRVSEVAVEVDGSGSCGERIVGRPLFARRQLSDGDWKLRL